MLTTRSRYDSLKFRQYTTARNLFYLIALMLNPTFVAQSTLENPSSSSSANVQLAADVLGKWSRSCALCHINGEADAPVAGDAQQWNMRLAQGEEVVLQHVIHGYRSMPPLGYCMSCEEADFKAMIDFMAASK